MALESYACAGPVRRERALPVFAVHAPAGDADWRRRSSC